MGRGRRLYLNPRKDLMINPKKSKKNHLYLCTILHGYGTFSLDIGPDDQPKKIKKKIKKKSKKNKKKNQNKITFIYAPYYTIMELLHWTLDLTINPKKSKKNQKKNKKKIKKKNQKKIKKKSKKNQKKKSK